MTNEDYPPTRIDWDAQPKLASEESSPDRGASVPGIVGALLLAIVAALLLVLGGDFVRNACNFD